MEKNEVVEYKCENKDDRLMVVLSHLSVFAGLGIVAPLIIWIMKKDESHFIDDQCKETLNFHISVYLYGLLFGALSVVLIGIPLLVVLGIATLVLPIIAAVKANDGVYYRYPFIFRFV